MSGRPETRPLLYAVVFAGALAYTSLMFVWFSLPASLAAVIDDAGLTATQAGILAGAVPLTYVPLGIAAGLVVDRLGPVRSLAVGLVLVGLAQIARSLAGGFPSLVLTTLVVGVGATAITFGLPKLVAVLFPPSATGPPTSVYLVGGTTGTALSFAVGRPILAPALGGWRPLFLWSGVVAVGYGFLWLVFASATVGTPGARSADGTTLATIAGDLRSLLTHRALLLIVVVATMYLTIVHGVQGWLPTILQSWGYPEAAAGQLTSVFVVATVFAVALVPAVADRFDARRPAIVASGLLGLVGLLVLTTGDRGPGVVAGIALAGFGAGGLSPLVRAIPPTLSDVGVRRTGTAMGLTFAVGEIGGFLGPLAIGVLFDLTGSYRPGLGILAVAAAVVVLAGAAMWRR